MPTKKLPKPTAANISKILAGEPHYFQKSETYSSMIRGWKNVSSGFRVRSRMSDGCTVEYRCGDVTVTAEHIMDRLKGYQAALEPLFRIEFADRVLVVTAKDATP